MKKIIQLQIDVYEFDDLPENIQEKIIYNHIDVWINTRNYNTKQKGRYEKAIDKSEEMNTPWFVASYVYDYCKDEIIAEIKDNKYLFDIKGELIPFTYCNNNQLGKNI